MLTKKDKIDYFKRECKNNHYYTEMILKCNERLEELAIYIRGVSSPSTKEVIYENAGDPYKNNKIYLMMEEEKIIKERDGYIKAINYVSGKLMEIHDPVDRQMISELYIHGMRHEAVAQKYHMTRDGMYKRVSKVLGGIL